jgi:hypothetical protein
VYSLLFLYFIVDLSSFLYALNINGLLPLVVADSASFFYDTKLNKKFKYCSITSFIGISHELDLDALNRYLLDSHACQSTVLHVHQFSYGQSNPTYLLTLRYFFLLPCIGSSSISVLFVHVCYCLLSGIDIDLNYLCCLISSFLHVCSSGERLVLRKQPSGKLLDPTAHDMGREFRVLQSLWPNYPVPRPLHYCQDRSILGSTFYVCSRSSIINLPMLCS